MAAVFMDLLSFDGHALRAKDATALGLVGRTVWGRQGEKWRKM